MKPPVKPPKSIVVTTDMMKPNLATAFRRWKELGEWPANAVLARFGPRDARFSPTYIDVETGENLGDCADLETLTHVQVKGAVPSVRFLMIFAK